ncbi:hypothetical protein STIUS_v1c04730 [Spiroplasma sp. TIUS-1]|uniref:hypothetical protein n=1 Tax=Spiroplasma sp. TIUS-1 TaxID=216963 RepID=UPI0013982F86|nr:hypothetical protein [Spiroplasma sp. TIUS-1]QHX36027.1 hypothetical protein STIUS_v1c04730 [Spiroplasma sp. TIUS-1]
MDLNKLRKLNQDKKSFLKSNTDFSRNYNDLISYIDSVIFDYNVVIKNLNDYIKDQGIELNQYIRDENYIKLTTTNLYNYFEAIKNAMTRLMFVNSDFMQQHIFQEVKEIIRYTASKVKSNESLRDYEKKSKITSNEYHLQVETFKYQFTVFDKLAYIAIHMNDKYKRNVQTDEKYMAKFYVDFLPNIKFLSKSKISFNELSGIIEVLTKSSGWHLIRRLRNMLEHDFIDPSLRYNINPISDLLYIYICRLFIAINETIVTNEDMSKVIKKLKDKRG